MKNVKRDVLQNNLACHFERSKKSTEGQSKGKTDVLCNQHLNHY